MERHSRYICHRFIRPFVPNHWPIHLKDLWVAAYTRAPENIASIAHASICPEIMFRVPKEGVSHVGFSSSEPSMIDRCDESGANVESMSCSAFDAANSIELGQRLGPLPLVFTEYPRIADHQGDNCTDPVVKDVLVANLDAKANTWNEIEDGSSVHRRVPSIESDTSGYFSRLVSLFGESFFEERICQHSDGNLESLRCALHVAYARSVLRAGTVLNGASSFRDSLLSSSSAFFTR